MEGKNARQKSEIIYEMLENNIARMKVADILPIGVSIKYVKMLNHMMLIKPIDMPNIEMSAMGGKTFWNTIQEERGYRLQVLKWYPMHARILNKNDKRIAWGTTDLMKEKFKRILSPNFLFPGDILGISRNGLYEHYAVYIGNNKVIHYAPKKGGNFFDGIIHEAPMEEFLNGNDQFFVLDFGSEFLNKILGCGNKVHLNSPEETIRNAKSRLDENKYNLIWNNCEHFAIWCKTGIAESQQVKDVIQTLTGIPIAVHYGKIYV